MKKLSFVLTGLLASSIFLTGCGGASSNSGGSKAGGGNQKVTINFLQNKPEVVKEWDKIIKDFEAKNPNITVKQINPPNTDTTLQADLSKGQMPDLVAMGADATFIQMAKDNVFTDLSGKPELKQVSSSYTQMLEKEVGKTNPYALPYTVNAVPIIYNVDLLKKYNLTVPTTWNELMSDAQKIKAAGGTPFYNGFKDAWTIAPMWNALAANNEPATFQKDLVAGTANFTQNDKKAADMMKQFVSYGQSNQFGTDYNTANTNYAKGGAVFYAQGIWTLPVLRSANPNIKLSTFVIPATNDASTVKMVSGVDSLLALPNSGNKAKEAAALKFVDYLLTKKPAGEYANVAGLFSTVNGVTNSDEALKPLQSFINKGNVVDFDDHYYPPAMAAGNQYESTLQGALSKGQSSSQIVSQLDTLYKQASSHK